MTAMRHHPPDVAGHVADAPGTLHRRLPATGDSVAAARRAVRSFADGLEVDCEGIVLAVSEAVANVVAHAYADDVCGTFELSAATSPGGVTVVVRDDGRGTAAGGRQGGAGYGTEIIRRLAERVDVEDSPDGVALTMRFRRGGAWSAR